ncbi:MAG: Crp/Fnr family transcriptional regulator [Calditrichia bacterium]|jgi:CRP-like cAMP-binding protein|nr:Crp/Fnr family transcriptional regulator [Calditrichia bacterium]
MNKIPSGYVNLFTGLDDRQLDSIWRLSVEQKYKKNEMILFEDELDTRLFIIIKGTVKLTRISEEGREYIFSFLGEGDFFGELSLLDDEIRSTNAVAVKDSTIISFQRSDYVRIFRQFPQITFNLLREMTQRLRERDRMIKSMSLQNATGKVACTILRFADDAGDINMGQVEIPRLPPHRDIANMVGTSRETISRAINWLTEQGYLQKEGGRLIIKDYENFRASFF